ncbi:MAG TPA: TldD/PmbA family protein, partial [bacterium]
MKSRAEHLTALAESIVKMGIKKGADQMEVSVGEGSEFSAEVREGQVEKLLDAGSKGLSLKVIVDHKVATARSSDLSKDTLEKLVENAVVRARMASADSFAGLPETPERYADPETLGIFDPKIMELSAEAKIAAARETERICLADTRIKKSYGSNFSTANVRAYLANSSGFSGSYRKSSYSCGVYLQAGEGDNLIDEGWFDSSVSLERLMKPEEIAKKAVHRVTRLIGAKKIPTQNVPVVFESPVTDELLGFLYTCVNGTSVFQKQSFFADQLDQAVGNANVTVVDDGLLRGAPGTKPFDREGVPSRKTTVIENGILKSFLLDTYASRKLNLRSTGNASGAGNLYLAAGTQTPEEIIRSVDKGLFLTGTIGFGFMATTGDISRGAFGIWIENGELAYPVAEITISGNLGQLLKSVEKVGSDLDFRRSITGPTILVAEMTVGG